MIRSTRKSLLLLVTASLLAGTGGCVEWLAAAGAGGFAAGWWARSLTGSEVQTLCYRNGEPIDCGQVPQAFVPSE